MQDQKYANKHLPDWSSINLYELLFTK